MSTIIFGVSCFLGGAFFGLVVPDGVNIEQSNSASYGDRAIAGGE